MLSYPVTLVSAGLTLLAIVPQGPTDSVLAAISRSVLSVSCPGQNTATGFLWREPQQVITALHVVAGCPNVFVRSEQLKRGAAARIIRVSKDADLALLALDDPLQLPVLAPALDAPQRSDELVALGYSLGAPTMNSINVKVSFGSRALGDMLPQKSAQQLKEAGSPAVNLQILRLEGHLMPGFSGAPILDRSGKVVAIGDGGLENGAVGVSWAIPIEQIAILETSRERVTQSVVKARELFAAELGTKAAEWAALPQGQYKAVLDRAALRCGSMTFTKIRTAYVAELLDSADDPESVEIFRSLRSTIVEFSTIRPQSPAFDIYAHFETGATFVLPTGIQLKSIDGDCVASDYRYGLHVRVSGEWPTNAGAAAQRFRNRTLPEGRPYLWRIDPVSREFDAPIRFDRLKVIREFWNGSEPNQRRAVGVSAKALEVLLARNDSFLGVSMMATNPEVFDVNRGIFCVDNPRAPGCPELIDNSLEYSALLLAGFLSTYPIG